MTLDRQLVTLFHEGSFDLLDAGFSDGPDHWTRYEDLYSWLCFGCISLLRRLELPRIKELDPNRISLCIGWKLFQQLVDKVTM